MNEYPKMKFAAKVTDENGIAGELWDMCAKDEKEAEHNVREFFKVFWNVELKDIEIFMLSESDDELLGEY